MKIKLKPCPFCRGKPTVEYDSDGYSGDRVTIFCKKCNIPELIRTEFGKYKGVIRKQYIKISGHEDSSEYCYKKGCKCKEGDLIYHLIEEYATKDWNNRRVK